MPDPQDIAVATSPQEAEALMSPQANKEFEETMRLIEADKAKKKAELEKYRANQIPEAVPVKKEPLHLAYKFLGQDPEGHEVTTIVVDTPAGIYASAYCVQEGNQIITVPVQPIPEIKVQKEGAIITVDKKEKK